LSSQLRARANDCSDDIFMLAMDSNFTAAGPSDIGKFRVQRHVLQPLTCKYIYIFKKKSTYTCTRLLSPRPTLRPAGATTEALAGPKVQ
jgi:hypothetical protein